MTKKKRNIAVCLLVALAMLFTCFCVAEGDAFAASKPSMKIITKKNSKKITIKLYSAKKIRKCKVYVNGKRAKVFRKSKRNRYRFTIKAGKYGVKYGKKYTVKIKTWKKVKVKKKRNGRYRIRYKYKRYRTLKRKFICRFVRPLKSIRMTPEHVQLIAGETTTLKALKNPHNTTVKTAVKWGSSDTAVATVAPSGNVTAVAAGEAEITASCGSRKAVCSVTVTDTLQPDPVSTYIDYSATDDGEKHRLYLGQVLDTNKLSQLQTGSSGEFTLERDTAAALTYGKDWWTGDYKRYNVKLHFIDVGDYDNVLVLYVANGVVYKWVTNCKTAGVIDGQEVKVNDPGAEKGKHSITAFFPITPCIIECSDNAEEYSGTGEFSNAIQGNIFLGQAIDESMFQEVSPASINNENEHQVGYHYINSYRIGFSRDLVPLVYDKEIEGSHLSEGYSGIQSYADCLWEQANKYGCCVWERIVGHSILPIEEEYGIVNKSVRHRSTNNWSVENIGGAFDKKTSYQMGEISLRNYEYSGGHEGWWISNIIKSMAVANCYGYHVEGFGRK